MALKMTFKKIPNHHHFLPVHDSVKRNDDTKKKDVPSRLQSITVLFSDRRPLADFMCVEKQFWISNAIVPLLKSNLL